MDSLIDLLLFLVIIGVAVIVCSALVCGIYRLIGKIQDLDTKRRRRKTISAIKLYHMVQLRIPGELTPAEYDRAVRYTVRKHPELADHSGGLDLHRESQEYIAELISEAVGQDRLSSGTLAIAEADRKLNHKIKESEIVKGEKTA